MATDVVGMSGILVVLGLGCVAAVAAVWAAVRRRRRVVVSAGVRAAQMGWDDRYAVALRASVRARRGVSLWARNVSVDPVAGVPVRAAGEVPTPVVDGAGLSSVMDTAVVAAVNVQGVQSWWLARAWVTGSVGGSGRRFRASALVGDAAVGASSRVGVWRERPSGDGVGAGGVRNGPPPVRGDGP